MSTSSLPTVHIYTDGACHGNPGAGGWAALLRFGQHEKELAGAASLTTSNRMELRAAINALLTLTRPCRVVMHTDSEYLRQGITQWIHGWQRKGWQRYDQHTGLTQPVKNQDLWRALLAAMAAHDVEWDWVKGHAGHTENERVDALAGQATRSQAAQSPPDLEPPPAVAEHPLI